MRDYNAIEKLGYRVALGNENPNKAITNIVGVLGKYDDYARLHDAFFSGVRRGKDAKMVKEQTSVKR